MVCTKCSVQKKVVIDSTATQVVQKPFTVCLECLLAAKSLSAREIAMADAHRTKLEPPA